MIIRHLKVMLNNTEAIENVGKKILKVIFLRFLKIAIMGAAIFFMPYINYDIPFIKETKPVWKYNYYSKSYKIFISFLV